jgi:hypothetical protein
MVYQQEFEDDRLKEMRLPTLYGLRSIRPGSCLNARDCHTAEKLALTNWATILPFIQNCN